MKFLVHGTRFWPRGYVRLIYIFLTTQSHMRGLGTSGYIRVRTGEDKKQDEEDRTFEWRHHP